MNLRKPEWGRFVPTMGAFGEVLRFVAEDAAHEAEGVPPAAMIAGLPALLAGSAPA